MNEKTNFIWQVFTNINAWIAFADAKAIGILAVDGVLAGVFIANFKTIFERENTSSWESAFFVLGCLMLFASFVFALECVLPRLSITCGRKSIAISTPSLIYFNHIAEKSLQEYQSDIQKMLASEQNIIEQITKQIWANSHVASRKYRDVKYASWLLVGAAVFGLAALFTTIFW